MLILGVARGTERFPFPLLGSYHLEPGDVIVYLSGDEKIDVIRQTSNDE